MPDDGGNNDNNAKHVLLACKKRSITGVTAAGMSTGVPDCSADWLRCLNRQRCLAYNTVVWVGQPSDVTALQQFRNV